jgi:cobalamin biosynthetic protein CobC
MRNDPLFAGTLPLIQADIGLEPCTVTQSRDHGGGLDAAAARYGGPRAAWIDLSTGINPVPYPRPEVPTPSWTALPDVTAAQALTDAARAFWNVPAGADILAAPGASALIANIPRLSPPSTACIPGPTYNEHAASFVALDWSVTDRGAAQAQVLVHPNNPDGTLWSSEDLSGDLTVIDESFCDIAPDRSLMAHATRPGTVILKSFGKFWGLAGLRLGFAIGDPALIGQLREMLGPWPVSGIALAIGAAALKDHEWATDTRKRLDRDAVRLDRLMTENGARIIGGTSLFRLYRVADAQIWQDRLAQHQIWSRTFPYASDWLRLGLPDPHDWDRLKAAL